MGGAAGIFPILSYELVEHGGWLSREEFLYGLALSEVTPGPAVIGISVAGVKWGGCWGGLLVAIALILPGVIWMGAITHLSQRFQKLDWIRWFLVGVQSAVPGFLAALTLGLVPHNCSPNVTLALAVLTFWLVLRWKVSPILLILSVLLASWLTL